MKKIHAFTMAEVLVTLGVIGIVAAMTLPGVIAAHRKNVVGSKLKKVYSELSQLLLMSESENENAYYWTWPSTHMTNAANSVAGKAFVKQYLEPYLHKVMVEDGFKGTIYNAIGELHYTTHYLKYNKGYYLSSGALVFFTPNYTSASGILVILPSGKSKLVYGKNVFSFSFLKDNDRKRVTVSARSYQNWTCEYLEKKRDYFRTSCMKEQDASGISSGYWCTYMVYCNDWKIPDDYPIQF